MTSPSEGLQMRTFRWALDYDVTFSGILILFESKSHFNFILVKMCQPFLNYLNQKVSAILIFSEISLIQKIY